MYELLKSGITPDKLNDEGVIYKDDIIDIIAIKTFIQQGEDNRENKKRAKQRVQKMKGKR